MYVPDGVILPFSNSKPSNQIIAIKIKISRFSSDKTPFSYVLFIHLVYSDPNTLFSSLINRLMFTRKVSDSNSHVLIFQRALFLRTPQCSLDTTETASRPVTDAVFTQQMCERLVEYKLHVRMRCNTGPGSHCSEVLFQACSY